MHEWGLDRRERVMVNGESVWMAPPAYVTIRKLEYYREGRSPKHVTDIRAILMVLGERIDRQDIQRWAQALGLSTEWASISGSSTAT